MPLCSATRQARSTRRMDGYRSTAVAGCRTVTWFKPNRCNTRCNVSDTSVADTVVGLGKRSAAFIRIKAGLVIRSW